MKEYEADLNSACSPYMFALVGLEQIKDQERKKILEKEFFGCTEKLRDAICREIGFPPDTTWFNILDKAGWIAPVAKEKEEYMKNGHLWAGTIKLSKKTEKICDDLEDIRYKITGKL